MTLKAKEWPPPRGHPLCEQIFLMEKLQVRRLELMLWQLASEHALSWAKLRVRRPVMAIPRSQLARSSRLSCVSYVSLALAQEWATDLAQY